MLETGMLLVGLLAGVMSGVFGVGGGVVMVPMLVAFLGMDLLNANATSLAAMLLPVGILGVINYYKAGYINIKDSLLISIGLLVGSYFGAKLAISFNASLLAKLYAVFLLYVVISYLNIPALLKNKKGEIETSILQPTVDRPSWQFVVLGVFAGVVAGMFGKGGGLVIVPFLTRFFRYDPKAATATSLAALQLPVGLPSVIVYAHDGFLNWTFAALMALGIVAGVFIGSKVAIKLPGKVFKKVYAVFLSGVAVYMVYKYF